jgi:hypothetical protein
MIHEVSGIGGDSQESVRRSEHRDRSSDQRQIRAIVGNYGIDQTLAPMFA